MKGDVYLVFEHAGERLDQHLPDRPELILLAVNAVAAVLQSKALNNDYKPGHFFVKMEPNGSSRCQTCLHTHQATCWYSAVHGLAVLAALSACGFLHTLT